MTGMDKYETPYERGRLAVIEAVLPTGPGRALDLGCGPGVVSSLLRDRGFEVIGVDVDADAIVIAQDRVPGAEFRRMDLLADDLPKGPFSVVTACEVIEHFDLPDQRRLLQRLLAVLSPTGHLVLSTPNTSSLMSVIGSVVYPLRRRRWDCGDSTHRFVHNSASLHRLLRESGFVTSRRVGFQLLTHRPWVIARFGMRGFDGRLSRFCYDLVIDAVPDVRRPRRDGEAT